ncbi:MAG: hypothetical protein LBR43_02290 [Spiroplasmataceae bacterium]|nr:hypothetical protein [Spiroplasmataceae bacterium]
MNDKKNEVTINKNENFLKGVETKDKKKKYDFRLMSEKKVNFDKLENNQESSEEIEIEYKESDKSDWSKANAKVVYEEGTWRKGVRLSAKDNKLTLGSDTVEFDSGKIDKKLSTSVHTVKLTLYGLISVIILVVVAAGWYFIFSNKEDKEEESL